MRYSLVAVLAAALPAAFAAPGTLHLLQKPAMNKTEICLLYTSRCV